MSEAVYQVKLPAPQFESCVTLEKLFHISVFQLCHL